MFSAAGSLSMLPIFPSRQRFFMSRYYSGGILTSRGFFVTLRSEASANRDRRKPGSRRQEARGARVRPARPRSRRRGDRRADPGARAAVPARARGDARRARALLRRVEAALLLAAGARLLLDAGRALEQA